MLGLNNCPQKNNRCAGTEDRCSAWGTKMMKNEADATIPKLDAESQRETLESNEEAPCQIEKNAPLVSKRGGERGPDTDGGFVSITPPLLYTF